MIIVKGRILSTSILKEATPILFVKDGAYCYVESGIVENELRVMRNWITAKHPLIASIWLITWAQGTEIPQELGDWLAAHQNNDKAPNKTEQADNQCHD